MKKEWLYKKGNNSLIIFFNGWGMGRQVVTHLASSHDVVMFSDYTDLNNFSKLDLAKYSQYSIVAWSMGVWAAEQIIRKYELKPQTLIAINGTSFPIHAELGIDPRVYALTEKTLCNASHRQFIKRMFTPEKSEVDIDRIAADRVFASVISELTAIRESQTNVIEGEQQHWDKIFISTQDSVYIPDNQEKWAQLAEAKIMSIEAGHCIFNHIQSWDQLISI